jgi:hypothetical protein
LPTRRPMTTSSATASPLSAMAWCSATAAPMLRTRLSAHDARRSRRARSKPPPQAWRPSSTFRTIRSRPDQERAKSFAKLRRRSSLPPFLRRQRPLPWSKRFDVFGAQLGSRQFALLRDTFVLLAEMPDPVCGLAVVLWESACNRICSARRAVSAVGGSVVDRFTELELVCHLCVSAPHSKISGLALPGSRRLKPSRPGGAESRRDGIYCLDGWCRSHFF